MKTLALIDGRNMAYRAVYSNGNMRNGAVYGFGALLIDFALAAQTRDIIVCWDNGLPGRDEQVMLWRKELDPRYKSNRNVNDELRLKVQAQLPLISEMVRLAGYAQIGVPGVEADDVIAVITHRLAKTRGLWEHVAIYSNDEDYYALLRPGVTIYQPNTGFAGMRTKTLADLEAEGYTPEVYALAKALSGCSTDTVKGIPGCGAVHALRAVQLGADPRKTWDEQPEEYRAKYPKHGPHWDEAMLGWKLTNLPQRASDVPHRHGVALNKALAMVPRLAEGTSTKDPSERLERLLAWLGQHGLGMLTLRRNMLINPKTYPVEL